MRDACAYPVVTDGERAVMVALVMWLIRRWYLHNCVHHRTEIEHLLDIARGDKQHH